MHSFSGRRRRRGRPTKRMNWSKTKSAAQFSPPFLPSLLLYVDKGYSVLLPTYIPTYRPTYLPYCYMLRNATVFSYLPTYLPTYLLLYVEPGCGVRLPTYLLPLLLYVEEGYSGLFLINIIQSNWIISMLELYLLYTSTRQQYYWACVGKASHLHIVQHL